MEIKVNLPLLPLRDIVIFPSMVVPLFVGREKSIKALQEVMKSDKSIVLVAQKNSEIDDPESKDLYQFGCLSKVLQLLKSELEEAGLGFCYLDGSSKDRMAQVDRFQEDETVLVFLISLKAGGTGLNLTGADVVVHFDPWWNPAAEAQASDRAHRIGQEKQITVYKMITSATVEEKVLQLQQGKRKLLEQVFEESEAANISLGVQDLRELM